MINHNINNNLNLTKDNKVTIEITTKTIKREVKEVVAMNGTMIQEQLGNVLLIAVILVTVPVDMTKEVDMMTPILVDMKTNMDQAVKVPVEILAWVPVEEVLEAVTIVIWMKMVSAKMKVTVTKVI